MVSYHEKGGLFLNNETKPQNNKQKVQTWSQWNNDPYQTSKVLTRWLKDDIVKEFGMNNTESNFWENFEG